MHFQDKCRFDSLDDQLNSNYTEYNNIDIQVAYSVPLTDTRHSGTLHSHLTLDINYPDKVRGYIYMESTTFELNLPDRASGK